MLLEKIKKSPQRRGIRPRLPPAAGGSALRPLRCYFPPTITALSNSFLALNTFYYPKKEQNNCSKCFVFASSTLLHGRR